jgi:hypothetical protein
MIHHFNYGLLFKKENFNVQIDNIIALSIVSRSKLQINFDKIMFSNVY